MTLIRFPFYKQLDMMDCGPTCLRMIAKYYGKSYSLNELRNKAFITREGVSLLGISEAAEAIGFRTIGVKLPFEKIAVDSPLPIIVHWNQDHFAVVYRIRKNKVWMADPAVGLLTYSKEEFLKCWLSTTSNGEAQGIALLLEPTPLFYQTETSKDINKLTGFSTYWATCIPTAGTLCNCW